MMRSIKILAAFIFCSLLVGCFPLPGHNTGYCGYITETDVTKLIDKTEYCYRTQEECESALVEKTEVLFNEFDVVLNTSNKSRKYFDVHDASDGNLVAIGYCSWMIADPSKIYP
jgi:hypothetical protein